VRPPALVLLSHGSGDPAEIVVGKPGARLLERR
jgi:hypothetical protein